MCFIFADGFFIYFVIKYIYIYLGVYVIVYYESTEHTKMNNLMTYQPIIP